MTEQFANNAASTLNGSITSGALSLTVNTPNPFPTSPQFRLLLGSTSATGEIVLVTAVATNTFTILRAQEGTTAQAWGNTTVVTHVLTAGAVNQQKTDVLASTPVFPFYTVIPSTGSTTFVNAGTLEFNPGVLTPAATSRTITLRVIAHTTGPQITIQLFNLTAASVVTGSTLTTSSTVPVTLTTGDLTANLSAGLADYQVQIQMAAGGTSSDQVSLDMASLKVTWT
jgi:hypothetical protein